MKHEIRYRAVCDKRLDLARTGHMLSPVTFLTRASAWRGMISAYDCPPCGASQTRNAAIKRLKRQGWRVQKVAVADAADYENLSCNHKSLKSSAVFWRDYAEKHCEKFELEIEILEDQLEGLEKESIKLKDKIERLERQNKLLKEADGQGWDAYRLLEEQKCRPNLAYIGLGAALGSAGVIGADLLLKAFG